MGKSVVTLYALDERNVNEAIDRIIVKMFLKKKQDNEKSFLLCGVGPGVGTTTLSINIAINLARAGWKTILVDADMRKKEQFKRLSDNVGHGLSDYLQEVADLDDILNPTDNENLKYISSGSHVQRPISLLCSNKISGLFELLKKEADFVIIDAPSFGTAIDGELFTTCADEVVLITEYAETEKQVLKETKERLIDIGAKILGVIVNHVEMAEYKHYMQNFDYFINGKYIKRALSRKKKLNKVKGMK